MTSVTCSEIRRENSSQPSGVYNINPRRLSNESVAVYCNMTSKNGTGVTVIGHDSEDRTEVLYYHVDTANPDIHKSASTVNSKELFSYLQRRRKSCFDPFTHFKSVDSIPLRGSFEPFKGSHHIAKVTLRGVSVPFRKRRETPWVIIFISLWGRNYNRSWNDFSKS